MEQKRLYRKYTMVCNHVVAKFGIKSKKLENFVIACNHVVAKIWDISPKQKIFSFFCNHVGNLGCIYAPRCWRSARTGRPQAAAFSGRFATARLRLEGYRLEDFKDY